MRLFKYALPILFAAGLAMLAARKLSGAPVSIYAGPAGYVCPEEAGEHAGLVASANWHASAMAAARRCGEGLLVEGELSYSRSGKHVKTCPSEACSPGERCLFVG